MTVASIPSPGSDTLHLGPISLHVYGICIALGVVAAVWLTSKRWQETGGKADDVTAVATWGVPAGIVGSRIYHVITDFEIYRNNPIHALAIWDGGLGIWGGIAGGVAVGAFVAKRRGLDVLALMDAAAPGLLLAQAIGRFGNYFNQELFGTPTKLPWGLHIDVDHRPSESLQAATYHPTFLYESLSCLALCALLIYFGRKVPLRAGSLFIAYVCGYTFVRFFVEQVRVDFAHTIAGVRINVWVSAVVFVVAATVFYLRERDRDPNPDPDPDPDPESEPATPVA